VCHHISTGFYHNKRLPPENLTAEQYQSVSPLNNKYYSGVRINKIQMGEACGTYGKHDFGGEDLRGKGHLEDQSVDGKIILRWIVSKWDVEAWTGLIWLRTEIGGGHL
jgi:hypothetical protein